VLRTTPFVRGGLEFLHQDCARLDKMQPQNYLPANVSHIQIHTRLPGLKLLSPRWARDADLLYVHSVKTKLFCQITNACRKGARSIYTAALCGRVLARPVAQNVQHVPFQSIPSSPFPVHSPDWELYIDHQQIVGDSLLQS